MLLSLKLANQHQQQYRQQSARADTHEDNAQPIA
jgi:hypothetical protein